MPVSAGAFQVRTRLSVFPGKMHMDEFPGKYSAQLLQSRPWASALLSKFSLLVLSEVFGTHLTEASQRRALSSNCLEPGFYPPDFTSLPLLQLRPYLLNFVSWFLEFHRCQHALQAAFAILESRTWLSKRSSAKKTTPGCFDSDFADTCKWCPPNNKFDKQRQKDCRFSSYALWPPSAYLNLTQVRRCCLSYDSAN